MVEIDSHYFLQVSVRKYTSVAGVWVRVAMAKGVLLNAYFLCLFLFVCVCVCHMYAGADKGQKSV